MLPEKGKLKVKLVLIWWEIGNFFFIKNVNEALDDFIAQEVTWNDSVLEISTETVNLAMIWHWRMRKKKLVVNKKMLLLLCIRHTWHSTFGLCNNQEKCFRRPTGEHRYSTRIYWEMATEIGLQKILTFFLYKVNMTGLSFCFYRYITTEIFNVFHCNRISL